MLGEKNKCEKIKLQADFGIQEGALLFEIPIKR